MNILISSVGKRNYIVDYFRSALKGKGKVVVSNSIADTSGMYSGDMSYVSPPIVSNEYIPFMLDLCRKEDIRAIIPLFDMDLSAISFNKKLFEEKGVVPIVSDYGVIKRCFDKLEYKKFSTKAGILTPRTYSDLEEVIELTDTDKLGFPLILKPRWGTGSIATLIVETRDELVYEFKRMSKWLTGTYLDAPVPEGQKNHMIIQEFVIGVEYGIDVINDLKGNYIKSFVKKKLGMRSGETDGAITVKNKTLEKIGEDIAVNLKHISLLDVDVVLTSANEAYVIDMNPRFGGGYPFTHQAGVNLPATIIGWLEGLESTDMLKMATGVVSVKGITIFSRPLNEEEADIH